MNGAPSYYLDLTTPLGDTLSLMSLRGEEGVSRLFEYVLELSADGSSSVSFSSIVGQAVTVKISQTDSAQRYVNGLVRRFQLVGMHGEKGAHYRAVVVPTLWKLGLNGDCRIFQSKSAPDIIKAILQEQGITDLKDSLTGTYPTRDYCVQYRESALNFISRLMEEEGIFYFFEHEDGKHTLVLADDSDAHQDCPGINTLTFMDPSTSDRIFEDQIFDVSYEEQVTAEGVAVDDYNFTTPSTSLLAQTGKSDAVAQLYDYPGRYEQKSTGETRAKRWLEALEVPAKAIRGSSRARTLIAGYKMTLKDHPVSSVNDTYVLLDVGLEADPHTFTNTFTAMPSTTAFRPPHATPKPFIAGSQTAAVVGKEGEEIYTDEYGRVKVQFHWDRTGENNEKSSCWLRVAQGWAGKTWGSWFLPRIGMEVVVSFIEGDPDRPLVTGCVYNAEQTLPYTLPDKMTTSTILSRSSKEGSAGNEIRFDDTKDSEEFYQHAQKDMNIEVENARTITIKEGDDTTTVQKGKRAVTISEGDESLTVSKGDRTVTVSEGGDTLTVSKGDRTVSVDQGKETHSVKSTRDLTVEGKETHTNKADFQQDVTGNFTLNVSGDMTVKVTGSLTLESTGALTVKSSGGSVTNQAGMDMTVKSGTGLTLQAGTTLSASASASGSIDGGGSLSLKGGMVSIN